MSNETVGEAYDRASLDNPDNAKEIVEMMCNAGLLPEILETCANHLEFQGQDYGPPEHTAEQAALVRRFNAHDKLVEALYRLAGAAARIVEDDDKPTMIHMRELDRRRQAAVEVLESAQ